MIAATTSTAIHPWEHSVCFAFRRQAAANKADEYNGNGETAGTPQQQQQQQTNHEGGVTAVDVFSMGVLLHALMIGKEPKDA